MVNVSVSEETKPEREKPRSYARIDLPVESGVQVAGMKTAKAGEEVELVIRGKLEEKTETRRDVKDKEMEYYPPNGIECRVEISSISVKGPQEEVSLDEAMKASAETL